MAAAASAAAPTAMSSRAAAPAASVAHSHQMPMAARAHNITNGQPPSIAARMGSGASATAATTRTVRSLCGGTLPPTSCVRRGGSAPTMVSGSRLRDETAEPALAAVIFGQRLLQHGAVEVGPMDGDEDQLAVGRLPQQEIGQALLAAGADNEIGIGQIRCVEEARQGFRRDALGVEPPGGHSCASMRAARAISWRAP